MTRAASAVFAVTLVALVWVLLHLAWYPHNQLVDYPVYQHYGDSMVYSHTVPYRDFALEYPPGALPTFIIPAYFDSWDFRKAFQTLMFLCDVGLVLGVLAMAGRRAAAFAAIAPLALGSVVLSRFDLWPAALASLGLAALLRGGSVGRAGSAVLIASAFAAKLWAGALAPLIVIWIWRRDGRRRALEWAAGAAGVAAAWFVPFLVMAPRGVLHTFHQQFARPLQIESLASSLVLASHHLFGTHVHVVTSFGSQNIAGPGVHAVSLLSGLLEIAALLGVYWLFARGEMHDEQLLIACAATVAALITFDKVFSPQYLVWLFPLVPAVRRRPAWGLFFAALVLTQVYFPKRFWKLVALKPTESWLLLARDLCVVALFGALAYYVRQGSTASSSARSSADVSARNGARTSG